jgi:hypothetical protein
MTYSPPKLSVILKAVAMLTKKTVRTEDLTDTTMRTAKKDLAEDLHLKNNYSISGRPMRDALTFYHNFASWQLPGDML